MTERTAGSRTDTLHRSETLHRAMTEHVEKGELPGLVTLVARDGDVQVDAIGELAFGSGRSMRRDTIFRIASLTKPIMAAATMMLVEEGKLRLDEPIDRLIPELANRRVLRRIDGPLYDTLPAERPITVEDLLTCRMGYGLVFEPSYEPAFPVIEAARQMQLVMSEPDPRTPLEPDEWVRRFASLPLMRQPGEAWMYNAGFLVLGVLLARADERPLPDVLRLRIFEPLGMTETGFAIAPDQTDRMPDYYMTDLSTGKLELRDLSSPTEWTTPPPFPSGAGGLVSTVDDYLAFGRLLLDRGVHNGVRLLSTESVDRMTTNHLTSEQIAGGGPLLGPNGWGYGMSVTIVPDEVSPEPGRYGWAGGYGTFWFNDPHTGTIAQAFTQTADAMWSGLAWEFSKLANG